MRRRALLAAAGSLGAVPLAGCLRDGWSDLVMVLDNATGAPHEVHVTVSVQGTEEIDRTATVAVDGTVEVPLPHVPEGATYVVDARLVDGERSDTREFEATLPLWGGNECALEPLVTVETDALRIYQVCSG